MRIEIIGSIGVGKTSLSNLLSEKGYNVAFEEFRTNPFWRAFYSNPEKYNFETEITFLLQHYHIFKRKLEEANDIVCDFSFLQDLAYAKMGLRKNQLNVFNEVYKYIIDEIGLPKLIIHLDASPETSIERIQLRGREEEQTIDKDFLTQMSFYIEQEITQIITSDVKVVNFNTEQKNFLINEKDQNEILALIENAK